MGAGRSREGDLAVAGLRGRPADVYLGGDAYRDAGAGAEEEEEESHHLYEDHRAQHDNNDNEVEEEEEEEVNYLARTTPEGHLHLWMEIVNMRAMEVALSEGGRDGLPAIIMLEMDECTVALDLLAMLLFTLDHSVRDLRLRHTGTVSEVATLLSMAPPLRRLTLDGLDAGERRGGRPKGGGAGASSAFFDALQSVQLRQLRIASMDLPLSDVRAFARMLRSNACPTIREVALVDCGLADRGARVLISALRANAHVRTLCLDSNGVTDSGLHGLAAALQRNRALESLQLRLNCVEVFPLPPSNTVLREVALQHNEFLRVPPVEVAEADETGSAVVAFFDAVRRSQAERLLLPAIIGTHARAGAGSPVRRSLADSAIYDASLWRLVADFLDAGEDAVRVSQRPLALLNATGDAPTARQGGGGGIFSCTCLDAGASSPRRAR